MNINSTLKTTCKIILLVSALMGALLLGQVSQLIQSMNDYQRHEIGAWAESHPEQASVADTFIELCLDSRLSSREDSLEESVLKEPMPLYDCGYTVNANQLVHHLQNVDKSWLSLAWPLSVFE